MSIQSLTAKYRPLTFSKVAGQESVKTILSRAAAEDRVAPAYLFSGTRGVGKTTIARIFAKALNCEKGPAPEPCNECSRCKQATVGVFIDVVEIDGASHGRVDDARALKETVGFAPQEGRYKVIIIDEAHMLSPAAFNALLKTLEEPPPRVTFIMATTEVRKFPATIVSRCQHYVFQMLSQQGLADHLENILSMEGLQYEPGAVQIIAKRGAGSVRDSMSLLGQALAMGEGELVEENVRLFLGLAGQDVFFSLMAGIQSGDVVAVGRVLRDILDQGLDLGFFLRELTACWRNLFLLRQAGEQAAELLSMSDDEVRAWNEWAQKFPPAQIHASWQMTIEGQRRVMTSLEPALALELLLLNLASLPELLDLERVGAGQLPGTPQGGVPGGQTGGQTGGQMSGQSGGMQGGMPGGSQGQQMASQASQVSQTSQAPQQAAPVQQPSPQTSQVSQAPQAVSEPASMPGNLSPEPPPYDPEQEQQISVQPPTSPPASQPASQPAQSLQPKVQPESMQSSASEDVGAVPPANAGKAAMDNDPSKTPDGFKDFVADVNGSAGAVFNLEGVKLAYGGGELVVGCQSRFACTQFEGESRRHFSKLVMDYFGEGAGFRVDFDEGQRIKPAYQVREEAEEHPAVMLVQQMFEARLTGVSPRQNQ